MTSRPNTAEQLGRLAVQMEMMNEQLARDRADLKERDAEASKSREDVRQSLAKLERGHTDLKAGQDQLVRRMDKVEPVTDMVTGFKAKAIGAMFVMGMIGSAIIGFLAYFKTQISQLIWGA